MPRMQEVSRSHIAGATAGACSLTYGRRPTRSAHSNPKFQLTGGAGLWRGVLRDSVGDDFAVTNRERWPALTSFQGLFGLIDELSAEFATDPPSQPTLAGAAFRQYDGELRGNVDIFGDYLY